VQVETKTALKERLNTLSEQIQQLEGNLEEKPEYGLGKGDPLVTRWELNQALLKRLRRRVSSVRDALARIEQGTYGVCERCGGAIDPERMAVLPDTRLCIGCAQEQVADQTR
jgi:DnaK suppressor protein